MYNRFERIFVVFCVALIVGALFGPVVPWDSIGRWLEHHEKLAGWAQAISSLIAIGVGAAAIYWQVEAQARAEGIRSIQAEIEALKSVESMFALGLHWIANFQEATDTNEAYVKHMIRKIKADSLRHLRTALSEVHPREVPGPRMKLAFIAGRDAFAAAHDVILEAADGFIDTIADDLASERKRVSFMLWGQKTGLSSALDDIRERIKELESKL